MIIIQDKVTGTKNTQRNILYIWVGQVLALSTFAFKTVTSDHD
jgi:hypothetical protein